MNIEQCCGCSACAQICPQKCILMQKNREGFLYPLVDKDSCIQCGLCQKVCPSLLEGISRLNEPDAYGMRAKNSETLENSSSGGIFSLLSKIVLKNKGVVYGAAMSHDMKAVQHTRITSIDELVYLQGSKYLQSDIADNYNYVKKDLCDGVIVLFSGTPCQINGLKLFLGKEYPNLYCVEVICHGVASPLLWEKYLTYLEQKYNATVITVNFRKKLLHTYKFGRLKKKNTIIQYYSTERDPYLQMFLKNLCLRPSCYTCKAKQIESLADITIADFWGVEKIIPQLNDEQGASLILIQSSKGKILFESIKNEAVSYSVNFKKAISSNPAYYNSVNRPVERATFFNRLGSEKFINIIYKYGCISFKEMIVTMLKKTRILQLYKKMILGERKTIQAPKFRFGLEIKLRINS